MDGRELVSQENGALVRWKLGVVAEKMYCKSIHTSLWSDVAGNSLMAFLRIIHLQCSSADLLTEIN